MKGVRAVVNWLRPIHRCHLDWGTRGAAEAAARGDVVVVVDVLSFATTVVTAVSRGAKVYAARSAGEATALSWIVGAEVAVKRAEVPASGRFSLSPASFLNIEQGRSVILPSPNGASC